MQISFWVFSVSLPPPVDYFPAPQWIISPLQVEAVAAATSVHVFIH